MHVKLSTVAFWATTLLFSAAQAETVEVTAGALNVRRGPGTAYRAITYVRRGQRLEVRARSGRWVKVGSRPEGWVSGRYVRTVASGGSAQAGVTLRVTAGALNVRSGPSSRYRVLGTLRRGERVTSTGQSGRWRRIVYRGREAYAHGAYLVGAGSAASAGTSAGTSRPRSSAGFIQMAASGRGFYFYAPSSRRWGTPTMVYGLERIGRRWAGLGRRPRMGLGDISAARGGYLSGHASHRKGVDVDVRPVRSDMAESPVTIRQSAYSRSRTQQLLDLFVAELRPTLVLFNDSRTRPSRYWPNHHNHFHARIR